MSGVDSTRDREDAVRLNAWVAGRVQGVGFRWWTRCRALELGLTGHATNLADGRVAVVAEGDRAAAVRLLESLRSGTTPGAVDTVVVRWAEAAGGLTGFEERAERD
ncbi:acylphosphatase [Actinoalloteichus sp. AHMU CJ021]|uniref:acylphosphatase n=1 Tax=Actinoalloteichus caeruleus DSM 43889 TaxID=1120930 RepID=A0ABT1JI88_ACTCY|nr:acylphosphatase [Actinoalloteichus caeruleus]AUS78029.1 acylphosphatase [Actinoalloteichus sp. AHMU CJ021]MCP2332014.1 acylphosphatase [Actinoalloteichus caeruleus DSM 43889]